MLHKGSVLFLLKTLEQHYYMNMLHITTKVTRDQKMLMASSEDVQFNS